MCLQRTVDVSRKARSIAHLVDNLGCPIAVLIVHPLPEIEPGWRRLGRYPGDSRGVVHTVEVDQTLTSTRRPTIAHRVDLLPFQIGMTVIGRIISLSSCSTRWQCQMNPMPNTGSTGMVHARRAGARPFCCGDQRIRIRVTTPAGVRTVSFQPLSSGAAPAPGR